MSSPIPENGVFTLGSYASLLVVAVASAWLCDLIISLPEEICMLRKDSKSYAVIAYIFARIAALGYLTCAAVMAVGSVNCEMLTRATDWFAALSLPATSMLFLIRVRAVFCGNFPVIGLFILLWISTLGTFTQPFTIHRETPGGSSLCLTDVTSFSTVGLVAVAVFDTAVFLAISIRLGIMSYTDTKGWKERAGAFFTGGKTQLEGPMVSRTVLRTGQLYYLASIGVTLASTILLLVPSIPAIIKCCVTFPSAAMSNAMACRVFRILKRMGSDDDQCSLHSCMEKPRPLTLVFVDPHAIKEDNIKLTMPTVCHLSSIRRETDVSRVV